MNLADLAQAIRDACGYEGDELTQATLVAAAIFADVKGQRDIGSYFIARAKSIDITTTSQGV